MARMPEKIPPFPSGLREVHLDRLPLSSLINRDAVAVERLYSACKAQGFFLLDLTESQQGRALLKCSERLRSLAEEAFKLSSEEKAKIGFDKTGCLFGWKANGITAANDEYFRKDVGQFFNVSKDDVLQNAGCKNIAYPSPIKEQIAAGLFNEFIGDAHDTGSLVMEIIEGRLGLPKGTFASRHRLSALSGDHVRLTYGPGDPASTGTSGHDEASTRITTTNHTDFGSVTILFNWLGGLQIRNRDDKGWEWVRPVPGHAIINLGDAMVEFGGKQLRSGEHRVVAAPGEQATLERYSLVYFIRPEDDVYMENLVDAHGAKSKKNDQGTAEQWRAGEWILHQAKQLGNKMSK